MPYELLVKKIAEYLSAPRLQHTMGVSQVAGELAKKYGADEEKARIAGLLHDRAREMSNNHLLQMAHTFAIVMNDVETCNPALLHAVIGACLVRDELGIADEEILQAIKLHTTGGPAMTVLDKIIYLADYMEPNRSFPGVEKVRNLAFWDLDKAVLAAYDQTINHIIQQGGLIHPATIAGRNELVQIVTA